MSWNDRSRLCRASVLLLAVAAGCAGLMPVRGDSQQIPAGSTSSLTSSTPAPAKSKKILHDALTPSTRARLQAAMDATPDTH